MKIIYSDRHKNHNPRYEWNFGKHINYPEKKNRVDAIKKELKNRGYNKFLTEAKEFSIKHILAIHDQKMVKHIQSCRDLGEKEAVYPHIFPYRTFNPNSKIDLKRAGYFCFDVGTQIGKYTFDAAKSSVDTALYGASIILSGKEKAVFSLCRPPGHHADHSMYGGYCYFNNSAIAANYLSKNGRVAILDLDFHHGNGAQSIFYEVSQILTISIHGDPQYNYPYFCGFTAEKGTGIGKGANINIPLSSGIKDNEYKEILIKILGKIKKWNPKYLVIAMGFDTYIDDPAGNFNLTSDFYREIGKLLASLNIPLLACLEGGYNIKNLGINAVNFFEGIHALRASEE